ncbi:LysR family transcriptional regulator [Thalassospira mesophila]|uniref:LysR family transcriptional regulator n=1 Tax=Thalassospira mesophila TaxID=1293891 RepID=A0A1Y2L442_9PROT|nr:LysR family transcriptional regulator [Thalassospira mesophila]OSQ40572.1 LysR family transcriptional regulator [Thalassospira mesophila]
MSDHLFALRLFVRVAHKGSFSAAGRDMNVPQPTVSRVIAQLEEKVGALLLTRTTRAVTLTDAGQDFLLRVEQILADLDAAEHAVRGNGELRGVLHIGLSSSFAQRMVVPVLATFLAKHPALRLEMIMDDTRQNFIADGVDLGFRFGVLSDSAAVARKVGQWQRVVVAAPAYLARSPVLRVPADLAAHSVIMGPSHARQAWVFRRGGEVASVRVCGQVATTVNEVATAAAVAGMGLASMSRAACMHELGSGQLLEVLTGWDMGQVELHAIFPAGRAAIPAARAFADFMAAELAKAQAIAP